jgi:hypothetical protein
VYPTTWLDQPETVTVLPLAFRAFVHDRIIEIRSDGVAMEAYITVGNLFGSQTVRCDTLYIAVKMAHSIAQLKKGRTLDLLPGVELLPNRPTVGADPERVCSFTQEGA